MGVSNSLQKLATLTEQLETSDNEIEGLVIQNTDLLADSAQEVDLTVEFPFPVEADQRQAVDLTATDVSLTDAGTLSVQLTASISDGSGDASDDGATRDAPTDGVDSAVGEVTDGGTAVDVAESRPTEGTRKSTDSPHESTHSTSAEQFERADASSISADETEDSDRPAYKDPERLAEVYDPDRTFAEMTEELGVDVTPKTVRHYMVEHGIHDPNQFSSAGEREGGSDRPAYKDPEKLAEVYHPDRTFAEMTEELGVDVTPKTVRNHMVEHGIHDPETKSGSDSGGDDDSFPEGTEDETQAEAEIAAEIAEEVELPDDITLSNVTEAVCTAKTLYEVQCELGIDRDQTRQILSELDLLELVHGRLSTTSARSRSREEVEDRIKEAVTHAAIAE
jgi:hypothetical protein